MNRVNPYRYGRPGQHLPIKNIKTIKIDSHLHKQLKICAATKGTTVLKLINQAVEQWLERENDI